MGLTSALQARRGPDELVLVRHGGNPHGNIADNQARDADAERLEARRRRGRRAVRQRRGAGAHPGPVGCELGGGATRTSSSARPTDAPPTPPAPRWPTSTSSSTEMDERLREQRPRAARRPDPQGHAEGGIYRGGRAPLPHRRSSSAGRPSGESWADVVLRARSLLADLREGYDGKRVWLFTHQAVIMVVPLRAGGARRDRAPGDRPHHADRQRVCHALLRGSQTAGLAAGDVRQRRAPRAGPGREDRRGRPGGEALRCLTVGSSTQHCCATRPLPDLGMGQGGARSPGGRGRQSRDARRRPAVGRGRLPRQGPARSSWRPHGRAPPSLAVTAPELMVTGLAEDDGG